MAFARSRSRSSYDVRSGRYYMSLFKQWYNVGPITATTFEMCDDVTDNRKGDNPFLLEKRGVEQIIVDGATLNGSHIYEKVPTQAGAHVAISHGMNPGWGANEVNTLAMELIAKTNPNAPHISIPAFLGESRELPGLAKSLYTAGISHLRGKLRYPGGESFSKMAATKHLEWRWGVKTLLSDLSKITKFAMAVEKRLQWLRELESSGLLKRNVALSNKNNGWFNPSVLIFSTGTMIYSGQRMVKESQKTWGSCNWTLAESSFMDYRWDVSNRDRMSQIMRLTTGLTPQGLTLAAWELMPWSWLFDWFANFQALLLASLGGIPVTHSRVCLMRRTDTVETAYPTTSSRSIMLSGAWRRFRTTKIRTPVAAVQPISLSYLPLLEADKWSILGSLAILRRVPKWDAI